MAMPVQPERPAATNPASRPLAGALRGLAWMRHYPALIAMLLGVVTIGLYWPATHFAFINYDDPDYVTANPNVLTGLSPGNVVWAFTTGAAGNWHPMTWLSLMLEVSLFGCKAAEMHFTNVVLHAVDVMLLFAVLRRLTGATWRSAAVAALFAWHPAHVESVAWVTERKDVLSTFFGWGALWWYGRYAQLVETGRQKSDGRPRFYAYPAYWLAWAGCVLGLMSKPMLVTWPCVLLLLDYWPLARWKSGGAWPLLLEKIPFFAVAAAACVVTFLVQQHGGAIAVNGLPFEERGANALISYGRYLGKLFWPNNLAIFYPHPAHWALTPTLLAGIGLGGISAVAWWQRRWQPFLLMGWLWYGGTLVPVIGLVQAGSQAMADRYTYIPSVGVFIMIVWGGYELVRRHEVALVGTLAAGLMAVTLCAAITRQQLGYWRNNETLFRHALAVTSDNFIAHYNLGCALEAAGEIDAAIGQYQAAVRIKPDDADFRVNLGVALAQKRRLSEAIQEYQVALTLRPEDARIHDNLGLALNTTGQTNAAIGQFQEAIHCQPDYGPAHYDLGVLLNELGEPDAAIAQFEAAIQFKPNHAQAHFNLGNAFVKASQIDAAIGQFKETIRLEPDNPDAHNNLGNLLNRSGQAGEAVSEFQAAVRLKPADADLHYNLGNALLKTGRIDEAIEELEAAIRLKPDYAPAHYNLGVALNKKGQTDQAIHQLEAAVRLQPDYAIAHNSLGIILAAQGRVDEAIGEFQAALRIKPDYASAQSNLARALSLKSK